MKKVIIIMVVFFTSLSLVSAVDFTDYEVRKEYNVNFYTRENENALENSIRYRDKKLRDIYETDYDGLTDYQLEVMTNFANKLINDNKEEKCVDPNNCTDMEKLLIYHDWIKDTFWYYRYPMKLANLSKHPDNPYYLYKYEYLKYGRVRARCNGFEAMMILFARIEGLPARIVGGDYDSNLRREEEVPWDEETVEGEISHNWVQVFVEDRWIIIDANADCFHSYYPDKPADEQYYSSQQSTIERFGHDYFDPTPEDMAVTHVPFAVRGGSKALKYISNSEEVEKLTIFLNKTYNKKTNGKRIKSSYNVSSPVTWFTKGDSKSKGYGNGRVYKIYWPSNKYLYGKLDLSNFTSLMNLDVDRNRLTSLYLENTPSLSTVVAYSNRLTKVVITNAPNLKLLSIRDNKLKSVEYSFNKNRTAKITATIGGKVNVYYYKSGSKYYHKMQAITYSGYKFLGWYNASTGKRLSKSSYKTSTRTTSFEYIAKFKKK